MRRSFSGAQFTEGGCEYACGGKQTKRGFRVYCKKVDEKCKHSYEGMLENIHYVYTWHEADFKVTNIAREANSLPVIWGLWALEKPLKKPHTVALEIKKDGELIGYKALVYPQGNHSNLQPEIHLVFLRSTQEKQKVR